MKKYAIMSIISKDKNSNGKPSDEYTKSGDDDMVMWSSDNYPGWYSVKDKLLQGYAIHQVKDLSTNVVFTVGERLYKHTHGYFNCEDAIIEAFELITGEQGDKEFTYVRAIFSDGKRGYLLSNNSRLYSANNKQEGPKFAGPMLDEKFVIEPFDKRFTGYKCEPLKQIRHMSISKGYDIAYCNRETVTVYIDKRQYKNKTVKKKPSMLYNDDYLLLL